MTSDVPAPPDRRETGRSMPPSSVSVCIATCNQRAYIRQCLDSVLQQRTDRLLEILVGDDCSDDGTSEIIAEYAAANPQRVVHLRRPQRLGASANIQDLLRRASGCYLAHLDGDDYWLPGKLEHQIEFLDTHSECPAIYANAVAIREDGERIGVFNDAGDGHHSLASLYRRGNFLNTSSMLYRAMFKEELLSIDRPFIDYRMHLLLARHGSLAHLGRPLVAYRLNSVGSMTTTSSDLVRELYWEAMNSVPAGMLGAADQASGLADFLRRVFGTARRQGRWNLLRVWAPRVFTASPYGRLRTCLLAVGSLLRIIYAEAIHRLRMIWRGDKGRVLYHR
ncbi:glycosyltransferase [Rhodanobacter sp. C06]|uniref:glycosyltransferase n=2 Tax=Rhodanobacter sp. C06 TaxID=1945854 RepID=UPI0014388ABF